MPPVDVPAMRSKMSQIGRLAKDSASTRNGGTSNKLKILRGKYHRHVWPAAAYCYGQRRIAVKNVVHAVTRWSDEQRSTQLVLAARCCFHPMRGRPLGVWLASRWLGWTQELYRDQTLTRCLAKVEVMSIGQALRLGHRVSTPGIRW